VDDRRRSLRVRGLPAPDAVSAQRPAVGLTVLGGFLLWQALLIWLVANSLRREAGVPGDARSLPREATPAVTPPP
jgi:hypothetical protein